jgi:hypothetical protein
MEKGIRFSIRFPLDLLATIKRFAQEDARSINSEIVWILRNYTEGREKDVEGIQVPPLSKQDNL